MNEIVLQDINRIIDYDISWDKFEGKKILVTGATGLIGSYIIFSFLERNKKYNANIHIVAMVRNLEKGKSKFADYVESDKIEYLVGDVTKPIKEDIAVDYVIHCASNAAPDMYAKDPVGTMTTNLFGTYNLLEFAKKNNCRKFLYVSTIEVYGKHDSNKMITEDDFGYISSTNIRSCYPESKKCSENLVYCYGQQYDLPVVIGRLSYIYGAGMSKTDSKVCAMFAREVAAGNDIVLKSDGKQLRSYTYVSDAITGLLTVLLEGNNGESYNIASSASRITIADMAKRCCELFPEKGSRVRFELPKNYENHSFSFIADAVLDPSQLEGLGWNSCVSLDDGLRYAVLDVEDNQI